MSNTTLKEACKPAWGMSKKAAPRRSRFDDAVWDGIQADVKRNEAAHRQYLRSGKALPTDQQRFEYFRNNQSKAFEQMQTGKYPERKTFEGGVYDITEEQIRRIPRNMAAAFLNGAGKFISAPATVPASLWGLTLGWTPCGYEVYKYLDHGARKALETFTAPSRWVMDPNSTDNEKLLVDLGGTGLNLLGSGWSGRALDSVARRSGIPGKLVNSMFGFTGDAVDNISEVTKRVQTGIYDKPEELPMSTAGSPIENFHGYVSKLIANNPGVPYEKLRPEMINMYKRLQARDNQYTANAEKMVDWWVDMYKDQFFPTSTPNKTFNRIGLKY